LSSWLTRVFSIVGRNDRQAETFENSPDRVQAVAIIIDDERPRQPNSSIAA
jgi:hypothetical protein